MRVLILTGCIALTAACTTTDTGLPNATALGDEDGHYAGGSYSPDGSRVAYWRPATDSAGGWQLWTANADLSDARAHAVRAGGAAPGAWSPDGSRVAVQSTDFGVGDVVVVPVAGGDPVRVTSGAGIEFPVGWFPDGDRFAYGAVGEGGSVRAFVGAVSTGTHRRLVPDETAAVHIAMPSPDGAHLLVFVYDPPRSLLYITDSAGGNPRRLLDEGFEQSTTSAVSPWSPDSRRVVFESRRTGTTDIYVADVDGGEPRQLTRDVRNDFGPTWSPDGNWIAFVSERGRQTDVWVVADTGGEPVRITDSPREEQQPFWRPGAPATLGYLDRTERSGLWAMSLADGSERRLTPDSVRVSWFNVANGGDRVSLVIPRGGGVQELAVVSLSGGPIRSLVTGGSVLEGWWAPNDSLLLYSSDRAGSWDLWVADPNSGTSRNLVGWPESWEYTANWMRNGKIVFQTDRTKPWGDAWVVDPAGGEPQQLTRTGSILETRSHPRSDVVVGMEVGARRGEFVLSVIDRDGNVRRIWDRSNAFPSLPSPDGEWVSAMVEQPGGPLRGTLLSTRGREPRVLLNPGESWGMFSRDGARLLYTLPANGTTDIAILTLADGSRRRLTTTPEAEQGAEFTPDGSTVVFRRTNIVQRIQVVELGAVLGR